MIINTIAGVTYCVTAQGACRVTAPAPGGDYLLADFPSSGGQVIVQAPSRSMVVTDDTARVVQFSDQLSCAEHVSNASMHVTEQEHESMYCHSVVAFPAGDDNADFSWCQLAAARFVSGGVVDAISMRCRKNGLNNATAEERYLGVWEGDGDGGWRPVAVSVNAQAQVVGESVTWRFAPFVLAGNDVRLILLASRVAEWVTGSVFGARCSAVSDGSYLQGLNGRMNYVPELAVSYRALDSGRKMAADEVAMMERLVGESAWVDVLMGSGAKDVIQFIINNKERIYQLLS